MAQTSRRQFLTHATLPVAAAVALSIPVVAKAAHPHPDAELLALGQRREAVLWEMDNTTDLSDEMAERLGAEWLKLDQCILGIVPKTGAGVAVQLAVVWKMTDKHVRDEDGPTESASIDLKYLWQAKTNAERMGALA